MAPREFESTLPASEKPQTNALDYAKKIRKDIWRNYETFTVNTLL